MRSKFWIIPNLIMGLLVTSLMTGCGEEATETKTTTPTTSVTETTTPTIGPEYGGTLKIIWHKPPSRGYSWEPISRGGWESYAVWPCLETLVMVTKEAEYVPQLATSWEVAPDGLSADVKLRQGVKFHDGTPFNAEAVKYNYDAIIEAKNLSPNLLSVDVVDEYTIRMNFEQYFNTWLSEFCKSFIVSPTAVEENGEEWASWNPVGTGSFKFVSHDPDVELWLERNDDWWGPKAYLDKIHNIFIVDTMTQIMAMKNGEANVLMSRLGRTMWEMEEAGFKTIKQWDGMGYVGPSSANPDSPWANVKVRQAMDYALDKDSIVEAYGYGYWMRSNQATPPNYIGYVPELETARTYDPDMARQLLAEAGYEDGFDTTYYAGVIEDKDMAVSIINYLADVGIRAELEIIEMGRLTEYRWEGWEGLLQSGAGISANFGWFLNKEFGPGSINLKGVVRPPGFHELILDAITSREQDAAKVEAAARVLFDEALVIILEIHGSHYAYTDNVHGLTWGQHDWWFEFEAEKAWMSE